MDTQETYADRIAELEDEMADANEERRAAVAAVARKGCEIADLENALDEARAGVSGLEDLRAECEQRMCAFFGHAPKRVVVFTFFFFWQRRHIVTSHIMCVTFTKKTNCNCNL